MGTSTISRLVGIVCALALVGCAGTVKLPNGTEMPESTYVALKSMEDKKEARKENLTRLMEPIQDCPEALAKDEYKDCQHTNQLWLGQVPWLAQSLDEGGADPGYWNLASQREARRDPVRYVNAVNQTLQSLCITGLAPWSCTGYGGGGGNKVVFKGGNRKAGGNGEKGSASASGDTSFSDIYVLMDKANGAWESDHLAQGKDSQFQLGDGIQGQAFSRPTNQPQPTTEGGAINNNSEGLSAEGSLE